MNLKDIVLPFLGDCRATESVVSIASDGDRFNGDSCCATVLPRGGGLGRGIGRGVQPVERPSFWQNPGLWYSTPVVRGSGRGRG